MIRTIIYPALVILLLASFSNAGQSGEHHNRIKVIENDTLIFRNGYSDVNGISSIYRETDFVTPMIDNFLDK